MLKTETNTLVMEGRVTAAAGRAEKTSAHPGPSLVADFEHGQWWVTCNVCGAQWSVVDAEGGTAVDGFFFERVTEGDGFCEEEGY